MSPIGKRRIEGITCPGCGVVNDGVSHLNEPDILPEEGAVNICVYCAHVGVYIVEDGRLGLRNPTPEEALGLMDSKEFQDTLAFVRAFQKTREGDGFDGISRNPGNAA